jgi:protein-tyrosine phosphatase
MIRICFVCLGNICRSPTAEGVMRHLVDEAGRGADVEVDSAGTAAYHAGEPPDARAREAARRRGLRLGGRARQFRREDFARFDYVIAMDRENRANLERLAPDAAARAKIHLLRAFEPGAELGERDVPDPYYDDRFDEVLDICEAACRGLLARIGSRCARR